MNILFLAHRIPYPPNKGDKIRSFHELRHLGRRHRVFLGTTLDKPSDRQYLGQLRPFCSDLCAVHFNRTLRLLRSVLQRRSFSVASFYDARLQRWVDRVLAEEKIDAIFCFCSTMAEYVFRAPGFRNGGLPGVRKIMDYVDLDSDKWRQYAEYRSFPLSALYKIEQSRLSLYEKKINQAFDASVFVAEREKAIFEHQYPTARAISVMPNGVDFEFFAPRHDARGDRNPALVFTGVMDYFANEDGVRWFCSEIFPRIRQRVPNAEFYVVGNHPTASVRNLARLPGVKVTGYVDDVRDYYWLADVCVIPLRIARGLQNKVLEAMATGRAVVATSNATDGLVARDGEDLCIADDPARFADEVVALLDDPGRREVLGRKARQNVLANYDWNRNLHALDRLLL